jgi:transcriptional regulator with XRE-family HTH domain
MTNTRDIIVKLKEVREQKGLSYSDILDLMEKNGDYLAKSTLSRVFADGSEELSFKYEETIRPIANALLDIENIEDDDDMDKKAMKALLKYKSDRIEELERQIEQLQIAHDAETIKLHEKMDKERESWARSIDFLKNQIDLKDQRMDLLLKAVQDKDSRYDDILKLILACPWRTKPVECGGES